MKRSFFVFLSLIVFKSYSQKTTISFWTLSGPEKCWVITHPFIAGKAKKITTEARRISDELKTDSRLDGDANGGRVDAFRHAYWMARMAQTFCWKKAVKLGKAHEKGNYNSFKKGKKDEESVLADSVSSVMDLYNNEVGVSIGCSNPAMAIDSLKNVVIKSIITGKMKIISKNAQGIPLDCDGRTVEEGHYSNTWKIPKCLIPSGF